MTTDSTIRRLTKACALLGEALEVLREDGPNSYRYIMHHTNEALENKIIAVINMAAKIIAKETTQEERK